MPVLTLGRRHTKGVATGSLLMSAYGPIGTPANTTETDLAAYTIAPGLLLVGDAVRLTMWLRTAANANNKRLRVYLGTTTLFDSTALAANNEHWSIDVVLLRTGAATQSAFTRGRRGTTVLAANVVSGTENMDLARQLRITGLNGTASANDLALHGALLERVA